MKQLLIAHDLGTSGNKATLFDASGQLVASASRAFATDYPSPGWAEQDPERWWEAVCGSTRDLLERSQVAPDDIAAISFSGQMMGCVPLDRSARPLRKAIIWADHRALRQEARLAERIAPEAIYRITGHRLSASNSLCKMLWLRDNEPELFRRTHRFVQAKDAIVARLTGRFVTDPSDASGTNLLDLRTGTYAEEILTAAEISADQLPDVVPSTTVAGGVLAAVAAEIGLPAGTPVVVGGGDGACATLGAGGYGEGRTYVSMGTSAWIALAAPRPLIDREARTFNFAHVVPGAAIPCGTMQAAGVSYRWIAEAIGVAQAGAGTSTADDVSDVLNDLASTAPAGSKGLIFLPYLLGERSPWWDPAATGAFIGLTVHHSRAELVRAVAEGVAMNLRLILDTFRQQGAAKGPVRAVGGAARSPFWLQLLADTFGTPVQPMRHLSTATSLGAAVVAGVGVGLYPGFEIIDTMNPVEDTVLPDVEASGVYERALSRFESAYVALAGVRNPPSPP